MRSGLYLLKIYCVNENEALTSEFISEPQFDDPEPQSNGFNNSDVSGDFVHDNFEGSDDFDNSNDLADSDDFDEVDDESDDSEVDDETESDDEVYERFTEIEAENAELLDRDLATATRRELEQTKYSLWHDRFGHPGFDHFSENFEKLARAY